MRARLLAFVFLCLNSITHANQPKSIVDTLGEDGRFSTLLTALSESQLLPTLTDADAITILAPTDEAFRLLPAGTVESLLQPESRQQLTEILTYHVIGASLNVDTVRTLSSGQTLAGQSLAIVSQDDTLLVNNARVIASDIPVSNGIVHVIDRVLLPPTDTTVDNLATRLLEDGRFTTLIAAAEAAGLLDPNVPESFPILGGSTASTEVTRPVALFAPTDEAFAKLPAGTVDSLLLPENKETLEKILFHHFAPFDARSSAVVRLDKVPTLSGQDLNVIKSDIGLSVNNALITSADQFTNAGTLHVIDTVLIPANDPETRNVAEVLQADGRFTSLIAALTAAELLDTIVASEDTTILAPTDEAFSRLTGGDPQALAALLSSEGLGDILSYHVLGLSAPSEVVQTLTSATTLTGDAINIVSTSSSLFVNEARVIDADINATMGVIVHAIDTVLMPLEESPEKDIPTVATEDGRFSTLLAAVSAAGLVETLQGDGPFTVLAPTDDAFSGVSVDFLLAPENRDLLTSILTYHVIPQDIGASVLGRTSNVVTLEGGAVAVRSVEDTLFIDDSEVVIADVAASNGTIHAIDSLLVPPSVRDTFKLLGVAEGDGRFTTLLAAVEAAGLTDTLKGEGPFTLLAPTDDAFASLPEGTVENLLLPENVETLREILLNHVISGQVTSSEVLGLKRAEPLSCIPLSIYIDDRDHSIFFDGSKVTQANVSASNGLIHVVDRVILPTEVPSDNIVDIAAGDERFSTLVTALTAAGLVDTVNASEGLTVFAPTNDAFDNLPEGLLSSLLEPANVDQLRTVLLYHVLGSEGRAEVLTRLPQALTLADQRLNVLPSGDGLGINNATVAIPDILATNGVIHAVDTVLLPTLDPESRNLASVLAGDGRFKTLLAAVEAAGLVETVTTSPALTILAPTDDAFASLPEGTLASLLLPENQQQLADLLLYHVIAGDVRSETVVTLQQAESVAGPRVNIVLEGDLLYLNQAQVLQADLPASNGVIHIIDTVIAPPVERSQDSLISIAEAAGNFGTLLTAVEAAGLGGLLSGDGPFTILAPTDDAFAQLGEGVLASLLLEESAAQLSDILLYHVFNGEIGSATLGRLTHPFSASGAGVAVGVGAGGIQLNGANVLTSDLYGSNGVIHVIDRVLIPVPPVFEIMGTDIVKGQLELQWQANRVGPYRLQGSSDLQTWDDILTTNAKEANLDIGGSQQFYRVVR